MRALRRLLGLGLLCALLLPSRFSRADEGSLPLEIELFLKAEGVAAEDAFPEENYGALDEDSDAETGKPLTWAEALRRIQTKRIDRAEEALQNYHKKPGKKALGAQQALRLLEIDAAGSTQEASRSLLPESLRAELLDIAAKENLSVRLPSAAAFSRYAENAIPPPGSAPLGQQLGNLGGRWAGAGAGGRTVPPGSPEWDKAKRNRWHINHHYESEDSAPGDSRPRGPLLGGAQTPHFTVEVHGKTPPKGYTDANVFARAVGARAEAAYKEAWEKLSPGTKPPDMKAPLVVDMDPENGGGGVTGTNYKTMDIKVKVRVNPSNPNSTLNREVPHEIGHVAWDQFHRKHTPSWVHEAFATNMEAPDEQHYWDATVIDAAREGRVLPIQRILTDPHLHKPFDCPTCIDDSNASYGEAHSFGKFLMDSYGMGKFAQLGRELADGEQPFAALQKVYGTGVEQLDAQWRSWFTSGHQGAAPSSPAPPQLAAAPQPAAPQPSAPPVSPQPSSPSQTPSGQSPPVQTGPVLDALAGAQSAPNYDNAGRYGSARQGAVHGQPIGYWVQQPAPRPVPASAAPSQKPSPAPGQGGGAQAAEEKKSGGFGCAAPAQAADGSNSPRDVGGPGFWLLAILAARFIRKHRELPHLARRYTATPYPYRRK